MDNQNCEQRSSLFAIMMVFSGLTILGIIMFPNYGINIFVYGFFTVCFVVPLIGLFLG